MHFPLWKLWVNRSSQNSHPPFSQWLCQVPKILTSRPPQGQSVCMIPGQFRARQTECCRHSRKAEGLSTRARTQVGTSCHYVAHVYSPPCPMAKAGTHLSSSTLRFSSLTRSLSALSMLPATCLRISPITSVASSSMVASEVLCRNSDSLFKVRKFSFQTLCLCFSQAHPCSVVVG